MEWLIYLCKVSACMGIFYTSFHHLLRKLTFFGNNRIYLLTTFFISFAIPLLDIRVESDTTAEPTPQVAVVHQTSQPFVPRRETPDPVRSPEAIDVDWTVVVPALYWIIALGLLGSFLIQLLKLATHARKVSEKHGHLKVIHKKTGFTNCSFLNYVFLDPEKLSKSELAILLRHEQVHVSRLHTVDKLLFNLGKSILWFNPFIYLYGQALEQVHEYEADRKTSDAVGVSPYAGVLLNIASRQNGLSLAHSFAAHPVKARIQMLFTNKSKVMKKLFYLSALPLTGVLVWAFAVQMVSARPQTQALPAVEPGSTVTKPVIKNKGSIAVEETKHEETEINVQASDTVWMVDPGHYGRNAKVTINGEFYDAEILTKISPRCLKTTDYSEDTVILTTHGNEIIYASSIDRENIVAKREALDTDNAYARFQEKNQDGTSYDYIFLVVNSGEAVGINIDTGVEPLILLDGVKYSEAAVRNMKRSDFPGIFRMSASSITHENTTKYGNRYDTQITLERVDHTHEKVRNYDEPETSKEHGT
jgi:hypothetical protein